MQVSVFNVIILNVSWVLRELSYIYVHVCFKWLLLNVALYSFFGARSMGTNGASAQVFKRKEKTKINMAARLSWVAFQLPLSSFLFRKSVHQKTPRNVLKKILLSSCPDEVKLRSQFTVFIAPTSKREDSRDRTQRKSQKSHGALFMVGGFVLSSISD